MPSMMFSTGVSLALSMGLSMMPALTIPPVARSRARFMSSPSLKPAFKVSAIDATGSGDAFVAGLALQVAEWGKPLAALSYDE